MICCKVQPFWPWEVCATIKEARDKCCCREILGWEHHWVTEGLPIAFPAISSTTRIQWSRKLSGLRTRRMLAFCRPLSWVSKPGMERPSLERSWALHTQAFIYTYNLTYLMAIVSVSMKPLRLLQFKLIDQLLKECQSSKKSWKLVSNWISTSVSHGTYNLNIIQVGDGLGLINYISNCRKKWVINTNVENLSIIACIRVVKDFNDVSELSDKVLSCCSHQSIIGLRAAAFSILVLLSVRRR